jgi:methyl-accepting chemotaxis protein
MLMTYFLFIERNDLIEFAEKEISGVHYLRAAQTALGVLASRGSGKEDLNQASAGLRQAEQTDAGHLAVTQKADAVLAAMQSVAGGADPTDAIGKVADLMSSLSDNSNITLDPDADSYFVGDILVNQATGILQQASSLIGAAHDLDGASPPTDDQKIAFAEARDGLVSSAGAFAADLTKAIKGNGDGTVKDNLATAAAAVATAVEQLVAATKAADRKPLYAAAATVTKTVRSFMATNADVMEHLLVKRIDGFHATLYTHLAISALFVLLGSVVAWSVVLSISRPMSAVIVAMNAIRNGNYALAVPGTGRKDEIGAVADAVDVFRNHLAAAEAMSREAQRKDAVMAAERKQVMSQMATAFESSVMTVVNTVSSSATEMQVTAQSLASGAHQASGQAAIVAAAAQQATTNVQTVASATEELSSSISEIRRQVAEAAKVSALASEETALTNTRVESLAKAADKIGEVIKLINDIASQTNLLALNATIEAARAGDAGKGFAVVAGEVKHLANQTGKATEEISGQISAVQEETQRTVEAIRNIGSVIDQVRQISFGIASAVEQQGAATHEIARNVQEAAKGTQDVSQNIVGISEAAHNAVDGARQVVAASSDLARNSETMRMEVVRFLDNVRAG